MAILRLRRVKISLSQAFEVSESERDREPTLDWAPEVQFIRTNERHDHFLLVSHILVGGSTGWHMLNTSYNIAACSGNVFFWILKCYSSVLSSLLENQLQTYAKE